jgi:hypothetical protein
MRDEIEGGQDYTVGPSEGTELVPVERSLVNYASYECSPIELGFEVGGPL